MKRYKKYKDSGVEWIGEIPEHWEVKRLKYIGDTIIGIVYSPDDICDESEGKLVLRSSNIQNGKIDLSDNVFVKKEIGEKHITRIGDILICVRNGSRDLVGKNALIDKYSENQTFGAFMSIFRSELSDFVYWFFNSEIFKAQSGLFSTSTINQLTNETLNSMRIACPFDSDEQNQIIRFLNCKSELIDSLIYHKQKLITLLREERTALINQAVTRGINPKAKRKDSGVEWLGEIPAHWEMKRLKYLVEKVTGGGTPSTDVSEYWNGPIPWVSPKDMKVIKEIYDSQDKLTELAVKESSAVLIETRSVLIVVRSGILKHSLPIAINEVPVTLNQDMKSILPNNLISVDYLFYLLKGLSNEILSYCNKIGATVDSIDLEIFLNFSIPFCSLKEQNEIICYIQTKTTQIDQTITRIEREIELLQEYRTALISEVVTGKICVV
ncbi:MAG: restriction endonuclease subunit S [Bacteroidetes bacterium]|nr:restriction endonuclease subunit S [Bacteroidota bacterium]